MLHRVLVQNLSVDQSQVFPLQGPRDGYFIKDIEGLGPVNAVISSIDRPNIDGEEYNRSKRTTRNLVFTIGMDSNASEPYFKLRDKLYRLFMTNTNVRFTFEIKTNLWVVDRVVAIEGVVETCEPSIFEKDPEVVVSVLCHSSNFESTTREETFGESCRGAQNPVWNLIENPGTAEWGFNFRLVAKQNTSAVMLRTKRPGAEERVFSMIFGGNFKTNDTIRINTHPGNKYARLAKGPPGSGVPQESILYLVNTMLADGTPVDDWPLIYPGKNYFRVDLVRVGNVFDDPFRIRYWPRYGGI